MTQEFKYLFTSLKVGSVTIKNRVVSSAHSSQTGELHDNYALTGERNARYHAENAKGGAGLIIMESQMHKIIYYPTFFSRV